MTNEMICGDCGGSGNDPGGLNAFYRTPCEYCGGSGTVEPEEEPFAWCNWCQEHAAVDGDADWLCEACANQRDTEYLNDERKIA